MEGQVKNGLLDFDMSKPNALVNTLSLNQPIIRAGLMSAAGYGLGSLAGPAIARLISPKMFKNQKRMTPWEEEDLRHRFGIAGALGLGLGSAALSFNTDRPWYGFKYTPNALRPQPAPAPDAVPKEASGIPTMPLDVCEWNIKNSQELSPTMKMNAMELLRAFDAPPDTPISGHDLVSAAIQTGISGLTGAAVGYVTASVLGLPHPSSSAILGSVANTAGVGPAALTSLLFGGK